MKLVFVRDRPTPVKMLTWAIVRSEEPNNTEIENYVLERSRFPKFPLNIMAEIFVYKSESDYFDPNSPQRSKVYNYIIFQS